jgi:hypothetical protein
MTSTMDSSPDPREPELRRAARGLDPAARRSRTVITEGSARGKSYTKKPEVTAKEIGSEGRKRRSAWLLVAVAVAALAVSGLIWKQDALPHWMHPWSATQQEQTVILNEADVDYAATEAARSALLRGEIPPVLAQADAATRQKILSGEEKLYTKRLLDENEQGGAIVHVRVSTGGVFLGEDLLTTERPHGTTFPARPGALTHFHFTVEQAGAKGVVSCYVNSVNGNVVSTSPMAAGQSADLEVVAQ